MILLIFNKGTIKPTHTIIFFDYYFAFQLFRILILLINNDMIKSNRTLQKQINQYLLKDYQFLDDYQIVDNHKASKNIFIAQIKNSNQKVRFIKKVFTEELFQRFKALYHLYKNGIVLADNMFILEQCEELYFYIIEAEIQINNGRFKTLNHFLYEKQHTEEQRKGYVSKIKILIDCLHEQGESYAGLDTRSIIVDEDNHLYLSPFQLEVGLKADNFSRAYYPPQILAKLRSGLKQISEEELRKWDYWSFGCVLAEVLIYRTPMFLQTSLTKQQIVINKANFQEFDVFQQKIKNLLKNSLNKSMIERNLSTQQTLSKDNLVKQSEQDLKKTLKIIKASTKESIIKQLNCHVDEQTGDSELIFNILSIQNIDFKEQLHIIINFSKRYHIYIDKIKDRKRYLLNKKITLRKDFTQFMKLLSKPLIIQVKEGSVNLSIPINLQSLVMVHQGRRIWNKQIIGTYKPVKGPNKTPGQIKISCSLKSPDSHIEYQPISQKFFEDKEQKIPFTKQLEVSTQTPIKVLGEITNLQQKQKRKKKKKQHRDQLPTISEIANSIDSITQNFKKKLSLDTHTQPLHKIKSKLQKILQF